MARTLNRIGLLLLPFLAMALPCAAEQQTARTNSTIPEPVSVPRADRQPSSADSAHVDAKTYVIGENDLLDVNVWKEKEISRTIPVRPDGRITLPLIGEIQASGMTPLQLQNDIGKRLQTFLANPEVTVMVSEPRSHHFNIVGAVLKPGTYPLSQSTTVLDAISSAGGFRDFAKETKIYVLRRLPDGSQTRLLFNYKDVIKGRKPESNILVERGDTIVVP